MVVCPACGSSRIRHDYRPAPFYLRPFLVRALLCDSCNRQFRAFSLRMPGSNKEHSNKERKKKKADTFLTAPGGKKGVVGEASFGSSRISARESSAGLPPVYPSPEPVSNLRAQITQRQEAAIAPESQPSEPVFPVSGSTGGEVTCPDCGSMRIRRRPRKFLEKIFLSLTDHKAYVCRQCGASFYHRPESR
jgi:transposase-like protein